MSLQDRPICWAPDCAEVIEHSPVYEAPCGHAGAALVAFHGLCLMRWREHRVEAERRFQQWLREHQVQP